VDRLIATARLHVGADAPVIVTGGDAAVLAPLLATPHELDPQLVLRGIRTLHLRFPA
jgi:pantothenate kinase type III